MRGKNQHLVPGSLDGSRLVYVDVGTLGGQHSFVVRQEGIDNGGVGLRPTHQKVHRTIRQAAGPEDKFSGMCGIGIGSIPRSLFHIGFHKAAHHLRMRPFHVVCVKV